MPALLTDTHAPRAASARGRSFLFAHWEGGGNTPPMLAVVRGLVAHGHAVRVLSDPCNREEMEAAGATFTSWTRAPRRVDKTADSDPLRDWELRSPKALIGRLRDRMFVGPSLAYAQDVLGELASFPADVIVTSEMLLGVMAAAESAGIPCVALSSNIYLFPRRGVPPFGPGLLPNDTPLGRLRDWLVRTVSLREFGKGTATFNETRRALNLEPLRHPFEQAQRLTRHVVLTSAAFDLESSAPPPHVVYAGPVLDDPTWTAAWRSPWAAGDPRPLVLVGFSTTFQNQTDVLRRVVEALRELDIRAVVTTGPAVDPKSLPNAANVHVCESAPHSTLLEEAAAVVTHAGHGTVIRALAAGVPLVCMPMGRDQNDNAARVVYRRCGVRVDARASAAEIRRAVEQLLASPEYGRRARALGERIVADARDRRAIALVEDVGARAAARS